MTAFFLSQEFLAIAVNYDLLRPSNLNLNVAVWNLAVWRFSPLPPPLVAVTHHQALLHIFVTSIPVQYSNKFMHGFVKFLIGQAMERESIKILTFVKL